MPKFKVTRDYRANHNGRHFVYEKGTDVEVDQAHADWVNRDSPGTLVEPKKSGGRKPADGGDS